jgi:hypothetical protein
MVLEGGAGKKVDYRAGQRQQDYPVDKVDAQRMVHRD